MVMKLNMVDLKGQYDKIREEVNAEIQKVLDTTAFINGPKVKEFAAHLAEYNRVKHVIPCGNGTDALQIALMALGLKPGNEVVVPAFTDVATAEVIGFLGYTPVMVDVDYTSFNVTVKNIERALTAKTKAIVPVHLFGQSCDMEPILKFASEHHLYVVEDNAQAIGAEYTFSDGTQKKTGTMGTIGCTSFFPSKNLGCYGDGGALMTDDDELAEKIRETDQDVILIFCTNLQQFALNGYSVGALGFIVKPIQWYSFHMYLTRALKVLQKRAGQKTAPPHIVVKDGTVTRLLDAAEIAYVEVRQHDLLYNLCGGDGKTEIIKNRGSMQEIAAQLTPYGFVRCSASYLVNLRCITAVSRMNVYIGGAALPIGRTYKDAFTEAFTRYMAKKEWEDPCRS